MKLTKSIWFPIIFLGAFTVAFIIQVTKKDDAAGSYHLAIIKDSSAWVGPGKYQIPVETDSGKLIWYGRELIENTSKYLGPHGTVLQISNGMNCQNCHLEAGTKPWGNNYSAVYSTYPKMRARSGEVENIYKRINDCFERSLNGKSLDTNSKEMKAMYAYIKWLGQDIKKGSRPDGSGIIDLTYLNRAASPQNGKIVFVNKCQTCHGADGQGQMNPEGNAYTYPPLWGEHSYNNGAGLFRLSRFAGYVKNNMPQEVDYHSTQLTDEEAWDVAAYVNSQPRPSKDLSKDWPDISKKSVDHPFGPFSDGFSEEQHKYGPFKPIEEAKKNKQAK